MEYKSQSGTEGYYRQMLELQDRLRKSEEERLKLEQHFNEIMQHSRDSEHERLRIMRHKYHKFLEEDKVRQERNENILRTLDRIEGRAKQLAAKTDRFKAFRKQYFENYLKQIPKQKQQTFELNTQSINRPQYQNESVRRKLFTDQPSTTQNENVETKLALLEQYLRDNFDNFPRDFPASNITKQNGIYDGKQTNVLYDNKNYLDDASDSKESQEIQVDRYSSSKMNGHQKTNEILGNRIEQELDRLRNKKEKELNNNSLDVQEINPEQVISDYKKLVSKSEEKYGLKKGLQNGIANNTENAQIYEANKSHMDISPNNFNNKKDLNLLEDEENSEDTKPPTDISLNLSSPSQLKEQFDEIKQDQMETLPQIKNKELLEQSSISEEITSIEKQKVQPTDLQTKPIVNQLDKIVKTPETSNNENKLEAKSENINNQQYIEELQSNEFGESVYNQQYSKEQKYPSEADSEKYQELKQPEYLEQYAASQGPQNDIQEQSEYKQEYENTALQGDSEEVYDEQEYVNPEEQYIRPEEQYANPEQQYNNAGYKNEDKFETSEKQYVNPEQQFETPDQEYEAPEQQYVTPEQQLVNPDQQYVTPKQQYEPTEQYVNPEEQYVDPEQQQYVNPEQQQYVNLEQQEYVNPEQEYINPEQQYVNPEQQQYVNPEQQQYVSPEQQQYVSPEQQQYVNQEQQQYVNPEQQQYVNPEQQEYVNPEQQEYVNPEQQEYVNPEQQEYVNPEQQQYPPDNYDQQPYPEGEYDPKNYPEVYDTQQPENYDTQNYPQQQYPEGYDPQQYTDEQQLQYEQQYPQGEGYQEQQFVENTGEYDPQGQYPENLYQTGQEYLQGEQNVDLQYESEQQQNYPGQEIEQNILEGQVNKTVMESEDISVVSEEQKQFVDNKPLVEKKLPNLADMLDTDTSESVKPDNKVSDSDFDFSNTKT